MAGKKLKAKPIKATKKDVVKEDLPKADEPTEDVPVADLPQGDIPKAGSTSRVRSLDNGKIGSADNGKIGSLASVLAGAVTSVTAAALGENSNALYVGTTPATGDVVINYKLDESDLANRFAVKADVAGTVKSVSVNSGTAVNPDATGLLNLTIASGGVNSVSVNGGTKSTPDGEGNIDINAVQYQKNTKYITCTQAELQGEIDKLPLIFEYLYVQITDAATSDNQDLDLYFDDRICTGDFQLTATDDKPTINELYISNLTGLFKVGRYVNIDRLYVAGANTRVEFADMPPHLGAPIIRGAEWNCYAKVDRSKVELYASNLPATLTQKNACFIANYGGAISLDRLPAFTDNDPDNPFVLFQFYQKGTIHVQAEADIKEQNWNDDGSGLLVCGGKQYLPDDDDVRAISINNGTLQKPDLQGNLNLTIPAGGQVDSVALTAADSSVTVTDTGSSSTAVKYQIKANEQYTGTVKSVSLNNGTPANPDDTGLVKLMAPAYGQVDSITLQKYSGDSSVEMSEASTSTGTNPVWQIKATNTATGTVKSVSVNNGDKVSPDGTGNVNIAVAQGGNVSSVDATGQNGNSTALSIEANPTAGDVKLSYKLDESELQKRFAKTITVNGGTATSTDAQGNIALTIPAGGKVNSVGISALDSSISVGSGSGSTDADPKFTIKANFPEIVSRQDVVITDLAENIQARLNALPPIIDGKITINVNGSNNSTANSYDFDFSDVICDMVVFDGGKTIKTFQSTFTFKKLNTEYMIIQNLQTYKIRVGNGIAGTAVGNVDTPTIYMTGCVLRNIEIYGVNMISEGCSYPAAMTDFLKLGMGAKITFKEATSALPSNYASVYATEASTIVFVDNWIPQDKSYITEGSTLICNGVMLLPTTNAGTGTVKSVSVNGGTAVQPDAQGNVDITMSTGGDVSSVDASAIDGSSNSLSIDVDPKTGDAKLSYKLDENALTTSLSNTFATKSYSDSTYATKSYSDSTYATKTYADSKVASVALTAEDTSITVSPDTGNTATTPKFKIKATNTATGTVKSVKVNSGTAVSPDGDGMVSLTIPAGGQVDSVGISALDSSITIGTGTGSTDANPKFTIKANEQFTGTVKSVSVNNGTPATPNGDGLVNLTVAQGGNVSSVSATGQIGNSTALSIEANPTAGDVKLNYKLDEGQLTTNLSSTFLTQSSASSTYATKAYADGKVASVDISAEDSSITVSPAQGNTATTPKYTIKANNTATGTVKSIKVNGGTTFSPDGTGLVSLTTPAGTVKSVSVNSGTAVQPDGDGKVSLTIPAGGQVDSVTLQKYSGDSSVELSQASTSTTTNPVWQIKATNTATGTVKQVSINGGTAIDPNGSGLINIPNIATIQTSAITISGTISEVETAISNLPMIVQAGITITILQGTAGNSCTMNFNGRIVRDAVYITANDAVYRDLNIRELIGTAYITCTSQRLNVAGESTTVILQSGSVISGYAYNYFLFGRIEQGATLITDGVDFSANGWNNNNDYWQLYNNSKMIIKGTTAQMPPLNNNGYRYAVPDATSYVEFTAECPNRPIINNWDKGIVVVDGKSWLPYTAVYGAKTSADGAVSLPDYQGILTLPALPSGLVKTISVDGGGIKYSADDNGNVDILDVGTQTDVEVVKTGFINSMITDWMVKLQNIPSGGVTFNLNQTGDSITNAPIHLEHVANCPQFLINNVGNARFEGSTIWHGLSATRLVLRFLNMSSMNFADIGEAVEIYFQECSQIQRNHADDLFYFNGTQAIFDRYTFASPQGNDNRITFEAQYMTNLSITNPVFTSNQLAYYDIRLKAFNGSTINVVCEDWQERWTQEIETDGTGTVVINGEQVYPNVPQIDTSAFATITKSASIIIDTTVTGFTAEINKLPDIVDSSVAINVTGTSANNVILDFQNKMFKRDLTLGLGTIGSAFSGTVSLINLDGALVDRIELTANARGLELGGTAVNYVLMEGSTLTASGTATAIYVESGCSLVSYADLSGVTSNYPFVIHGKADFDVTNKAYLPLVRTGKYFTLQTGALVSFSHELPDNLTLDKVMGLGQVWAGNRLVYPVIGDVSVKVNDKSPVISTDGLVSLTNIAQTIQDYDGRTYSTDTTGKITLNTLLANRGTYINQNTSSGATIYYLPVRKAPNVNHYQHNVFLHSAADDLYYESFVELNTTNDLCWGTLFRRPQTRPTNANAVGSLINEGIWWGKLGNDPFIFLQVIRADLVNNVKDIYNWVYDIADFTVQKYEANQVSNLEQVGTLRFI